jgi:hypothetical protein
MLGGQIYPMKNVGNCHTCQSPYRYQIESLIVQAIAYSRILNDVLAIDPDARISVISMKTHFDRGHMPVQTEYVRRTTERHARERGEGIDALAGAIADGLTFAEVVLSESMAAIARGELKPTVSDGLQAAQIMERFGTHEEAASEDEYVQAFMIYHETAEKVMTEVQFRQFGEMLSQDPTLRALISRRRAEPEPDAQLAIEGDFYSTGAGTSEGQVLYGEVVDEA